MKIKSDFVTNSSSASFTILKEDLTGEQLILIYNHMEVAAMLVRKNKKEYLPQFTGFGSHDEWLITEEKDTVSGSTTMTNFDMYWYLTKILKIPEDKIRYESQ